MALEWSLKLKDGMSGPTKSAADALGELEKRLKSVRSATDAAASKTEFFRDKAGRLRHVSGRFATEAEKIAQGLGGVASAAAKGAPKLGKWTQLTKTLFGAKAGGFVGQLEEGLGKKVFGKMTTGQMLGGVASAGAAAGAAFVAAFAVVAATLVGVVANVMGQIAAFQQSKSKTLFAFDKLLGPGGGEKAWERIRAAADKTKTPIQETAQAFNNLVAAGFKIEHADTIFRQLADLKTLNPQANIDGIVRAIGQIRNIGKLQGDELNQISEAGVNVDDVYTELSKRLGKTRDEVMKLKEAGKIKSDDAIAAIQASIAKRTGGDPGAVAGAAPKSFAESWERLKQKFFDMVHMDFGPVTRFLEKLESALDGDAGRQLADAFEDLAKAAGEVLDSFTKEDLEGIIKGAAGVVRDMASGLRDGAAAAREINEAMRAIDRLRGKEGGSTTSDAIGIGWSSFKGTIKGVAQQAMGPLGAAWQMVDLLSPLADKFGEAWAWISAQGPQWYASAISLGTSLVDGIIAGLRAQWDALLADVSSLGASARDAFGFAIGEGSPAKKFMPAGESIAQGVGVGVQKGTPFTTASVDSMALAMMGRAGASLGKSIRAGSMGGGSDVTLNMTNPDPSQYDQRVRQIVRQELRLRAT